MWREIPQVSPCTNTKMSSPRLPIYYFTHSQFLQVLLSWYESWGTKNVFLSMQYFKRIWMKKWRLPKCWRLIVLSVWILRRQCSRHPSPKGPWKWQPERPRSRSSASVQAPSKWRVSLKFSPVGSQMVKKWGELWIWQLDSWFKSFYSCMKWMLAYSALVSTSVKWGWDMTTQTHWDLCEE